MWTRKKYDTILSRKMQETPNCNKILICRNHDGNKRIYRTSDITLCFRTILISSSQLHAKSRI